MGNKTIRAKIQCFPGDGIVVTREQVKDLIKSEGLKPSDLFEVGALSSDPVVRGYADDLVKERIGRTWREKKEAEEELEKLKTGHTTREAALQKENDALKANLAKTQVGSLLEKQRAERKLDDRQVKFIQKRLPDWKPEKPEELEKEFNSFLDKQIDDYRSVAKDVFGIEDKPAGETGKEKPTPGAEPGGTGDKGAEPENKYTDPKQNPFIKAG